MKFISFEGIEGSGKSTQSKMLHQALADKAIDTILTREPGGTKEAENIREFILQTSGLLPITELLLHNAARYEHVQNLILPALAAGKLVICDRFLDSTIAYQGYSMNIGEKLPLSIHQLCLNNMLPSLTFIIDINPEIGVTRAKQGKGANRYDHLDLSFHKHVREAFLKIGKQHKDRCVVLDGRADIDTIHKKIIAVVNERFPALSIPTSS